MLISYSNMFFIKHTTSVRLNFTSPLTGLCFIIPPALYQDIVPAKTVDILYQQIKLRRAGLAGQSCKG